MERLQAALTRARAQRGGAVLPPVEDLRFRAKRGGAMRSLRRRAAVIDEVWQALPELEVHRDIWNLHRLVAAEGGTDAAPFDLLRTKLLRLVRKHRWKRVAILSANADAGKSTTITNLSLSFARQSDVRAMVFDFDLRRPSMGRLLAQHLHTNMGQVLRGELPFEEHARRFGDNMVYALNDLPVSGPAELLQSQRTEDFICDIEETYATDLILFDMPPMMVADDAHGFLRWVDAALIVIEAEKTTTRQIDILEKQVAELTNVAGIVLNKCNYMDEYANKAYEY